MTESQSLRPPYLGLVCITTSDRIRYRTTTLKHLNTLSTAAQTAKLRAIYADNLTTLSAAADWCRAHQVRLYRVTARLFPFADLAPGDEILTEFAAQAAEVGRKFIDYGIRLLVHPDQFVVLNSDRPQVIENSIAILRHHAHVMDLLQQPRSPWAVINIHGGKGQRAERLVEQIAHLPDAVRARLTLENDEHAYSADEIVAICRRAGVPMVFDAHHHVVNAGLDSYDDPSVVRLTQAARATWPLPEWQVVHISNGRETFGDRRHHDFINAMPSAFADVAWIEVEAKQKELAIENLRRSWPPLIAKFGGNPPTVATAD